MSFRFPLDFSKRLYELPENLDRSDSDRVKVKNTYVQFKVINPIFARWRHIYKHLLKPLLEESPATNTILDIGFGGGDILLRLAGWAQRDGFQIQATGIDKNPEAMGVVRERKWPANFEFFEKSTDQLIEENRKFDFVISNHLLHHFNDRETLKLFDQAEMLAVKRVIFSDIIRSAAGYYLFALGTSPFFHHSYVVSDGLISIRRSFTVEEMRRLCPDGWRVHRIFPFRMVIIK
jgi:2-polyprenyl-3-methyl-5-hydroxy-6-metoxy-1,4-benzoquinol methylase